MNIDNNKLNSEWYSSNTVKNAGQSEDVSEATSFSVLPEQRSEHAPLPEAVDTQKKRGYTRSRVIAAALCLLLLIIGTSLAFSKARGSAPFGLSDPVVSYAPKIAQPEIPFEGNDFESFFERFYSTDEKQSEEISIPKLDSNPGITMKTDPKPSTAELSLQELYLKCSPYVVAIAAHTGPTGYNWGSGIVMTEDGYILTNTHVLEGAKSATVTLSDDREFEAKLVGYDNISDVAVLKVEATGLLFAEFCETPVTEGDRVVAIGNPLGEQLRGTMTDGIISAISRDMSYNGHVMTLLQTNAAINEGNSGGPLINMHGQVIGITNMKMMSVSSAQIEGIGFAIPMSTVKQVVDSILSNGVVIGRPMIGITVGAIPEEVAEYYKLPNGLYITKVNEGSDAQKVGVQAGDILTAVDGKPVTETKDVMDSMSGKNVGDILTFSIFRDGRAFDVEVKLVESSDIY